MGSSKPIPLAHPPLKVLIVGAGVGGLTLANLLEKAKIEYEIYEKASSFKPLGSAINLSSQVFTFLDQLGIYNDLEVVSKIFKNLNVRSLDLETNEMKFKGTYEIPIDQKARFGYDSFMMARPDLMEALLKQIPRHKIFLRKRILSIQQNEEGVMLRAADGSTHHGDICVAADGCYSAVRQSMFAGIEKKNGILPQSDQAPLQYNIDCVVGVTRPLDPVQYAEVAQEKCEFQVVLNKQQAVSVWYMPLTNNRLGWMVNEMISKEKKSILRFGNLNKSVDDNNFKQTEWTPDAAIEMCNRFADQPTPYGTTLADLFSKTPSELISKVMLEEKYFETWTDGRTALIGDACHKVLPFGAVGATNAMHDALQLANLLYDLRSNSYQDIQDTLREYHRMRKGYGKDAVEGCASASKLFHNQGFFGDLMRNMALNKMPDWVITKGVEKIIFYRPQVTFLPFLSNTGTAQHVKQEYSTRYLMELEAGKAKAI